MKKLRGISLILSLAVILSTFNFSAYAEENTITAYITISMYGEIVKDKNGDYLAEKPVTLSGKESYNLDDAFYEAHELYYEGGAEAGYASELYTSSWGSSLSITKAWGDTSTKFGYQMNLGDTSVMGLEQTLSDGDYIDLCIYENYYPDTESYSKFDAYKKDLDGDTTELTLYESYYGPKWETLFRPCVGAEITIDGKLTGILTDENGKCTITFDKAGENLVSAKKTKVLVDEVEETESIVTAITAPVCVVTAKMLISVDARYVLNIEVEDDIDVENAKMIVAGYRDNQLIDIATDIIWSQNTATVYLNKRATDIKLFLWKTVEGQEPLVNRKIINLK